MPSSLVMNERTCRVFVFSNCTTAPTAGLSSVLVTAPCTLRVEASPFLGFPWAYVVCAKLAGTDNARIAVRTKQIVFMRSSLILDVAGPGAVSSESTSSPHRLLPLLLPRSPLHLRPLLPPRRPIPVPEDRCSPLSGPRHTHRN